jgi:hypothetical protein
MSICPLSGFLEMEGWDFAVVQALATVGVEVPSAHGRAPLGLLLSPITYNCQVQNINYTCINDFTEYTDIEKEWRGDIAFLLPTFNKYYFSHMWHKVATVSLYFMAFIHH